MKQLFSLFIFASFLFISCDEIAPTISPQMDVETDICDEEIDVSAQLKQVLIEEFTGVNCNNCPKGSRELERLKDQFGEQLIILSIHAGSFAVKLNPEDEDLWTSTGEDILNFVGQPIGYPTAVIDRQEFDNSFGLHLGPESKWVGNIELEVVKPVSIQLGIAHQYDANTRELDMCFRMYPQVDINFADIRLTVLIKESGMIVPQKDNEAVIEIVDNYEHKHVLRTSISASTGDKILEDFTVGAIIEKPYTFTVPDNWKAEKCDIVAFVSVNDEDTREVIQAMEVKVVE